jgi:anaerobic magnesium-protoporphyrin IX monomethyl ester cyclase
MIMPDLEAGPLPKVVLIGFQEQGNLGIGYLAAVLRQHSYEPIVLDFQEEQSTLVANTLREQPILVGLSLIFQVYLTRFASLAQALGASHFRCRCRRRV